MVFRSLSVPSDCVGSVLVSFLLFLLEPVAEKQDHYTGCVGEIRKFGPCNSRSLQELLDTRVSPAIRRCVASTGGRNIGDEDQLSSGVYAAGHPVLVVVIRIFDHGHKQELLATKGPQVTSCDCLHKWEELYVRMVSSCTLLSGMLSRTLSVPRELCWVFSGSEWVFDVPSMLLGSVLSVLHWQDYGVELPSQV